MIFIFYPMLIYPKCPNVKATGKIIIICIDNFTNIVVFSGPMGIRPMDRQGTETPVQVYKKILNPNIEIRNKFEMIMS